MSQILVLKDKVSFPGSKAYNASLGSYYSLQEAGVQPHCIFSPRSAGDVSEAVKALAWGSTSNDACPSTAEPCQFAVRSGGHASFAGAANIPGGVTFDLSGIDDISLASDRSTVSVGAGNTWGRVYSNLDAQGLAVAGGRASSVGVGGLSLGGGISYLGPRVGWTVDTVESYEVVLADGSIVTASQRENPDLLWALRGGGNNFGVVTRVELQAFEQGNLWGGFVDTLYATTVNEQIDLLADFVNSDHYDDYASLETSFAYSGAEDIQVVVNNMEYTKAVVDPSVYHALAKLPSVATTQRLASMYNLTTEVDSRDPKGLRSVSCVVLCCVSLLCCPLSCMAKLPLSFFLFFSSPAPSATSQSRWTKRLTHARQATATVTIESSVEAINATVRAWNATVPSVRSVAGAVWDVSMDPLPSALYTRHASTNALGLTGRGGRPLIIVMATMSWTNATDDQLVDTTLRNLIATIQHDVGELGQLDPFVYLNYAAQWQDPFAGYGSATVDRLLEVQRRYDPRGLYARMVPGGFKLPK